MKRVSKIFSKKSKSKKSFKEEAVSNESLPTPQEPEASAAETIPPSPPVSTPPVNVEQPPLLGEYVEVADFEEDEEEKDEVEEKEVEIDIKDEVEPRPVPVEYSGPPIVACPEGGRGTFLTTEQLDLIQKMRLLIPTLYPDPIPPYVELCGDLRLLRFLEGYGCDVGAASQAYVSMLEWRKRSDMDTVRESIMENWDDDLHCYTDEDFPNKTVVLKHLPLELNYAYSVPTSGRPGHLVTLEKTGQGEPLALMDEISLDDYINFEKQNMEHKAILLDRRSRELGYLVKIIAIRDMSGLGMKHCGARGVNMMTSVLKMMQGAYPEVIENIFMINAPWIFSTLWGLVKPFVAPRTIEKIKIFSAGDMKNAQILLRDRIGAAQLPLRYGGTRPDVEPRKPPTKKIKKPEPTMIVPTAAAAEAPKKTVCPKSEPCEVPLVDQLPDEVIADVPVEVKKGGFKTAPSAEGRSDIPAKAHLAVELDVDMDTDSLMAEDSKGVIVSWGFKLITFLATMDIGFSVSFKSKLTDEVQVVREYSRVPEFSPHCSGSWSTKIPGTITFTWDNSYSMFLTKEIEYKINVWEAAEGDANDDASAGAAGGGERKRSLSFTSILSDVDGTQLSSLLDQEPNTATFNAHSEDDDGGASVGSFSNGGGGGGGSSVGGDEDGPFRSNFGFDISLSEKLLSEYLSFSSSPNKEEDNKTNKDGDENQKNIKEAVDKPEDEGNGKTPEEPSFWEKFMSSSSTKGKTKP